MASIGAGFRLMEGGATALGTARCFHSRLFQPAGKKLRNRNDFSRNKPSNDPATEKGSKTDQKLMAIRFIVMKGESTHA